jgi:hypothetical protein
MTNVGKVKDDEVAALEAATEESVQRPTILASRYFPNGDGGFRVMYFWMEDQPSLRQIKVRNPETRQEVTSPVPKERLDDAVNSGECDGLVYGWYCDLPPGFVSGDTQALELSAPGQKIPATCYPSRRLPDATAAPGDR